MTDQSGGTSQMGTKRGWGAAVGAYSDKRIISFLFLGFTAGLPWLLVYTVLSNWLRQAGIDRTTIGLISWVGFAYAFKFAWAPFVDRLTLPVLGNRLGRRRSWMILAVITAIAGLIGMALTGPAPVLDYCPSLPAESLKDLAKFPECKILVDAYLAEFDLTPLIGFAILTAFASATFDIALDAYRIEIAEPELQGATTGMYIGGYRLALAVGGGLALIFSEISWTVSYLIMASSLLGGLVITLLIREPKAPALTPTPGLAAWTREAVALPFVDFFRRYGAWAAVILCFMALYKLSDIVMAVMAQPFYVDLGFDNVTIGGITKVYGLILTITGTLAGGVVVARYGTLRPLALGVVMVALPNVLYAVMAGMGKDVWMLTLAISADNFGSGFAAAILVAYLSGMTNTLYTATQYALFSSFMTLPAKFLGGFSGWLVDTIGYQHFFLITAALGIPGICLALILAARQGRLTANQPA